MTNEVQEQAFTQEPPQAEHKRLQRFVGEWTWEGDGGGAQTVEALSDLWVVGHGTGDMGATQVTLGFDSKRKRFVGTWVGSMATHHWVYEGRLEGNALTLDCEGPAFEGSSGMQKYRDVHEFVDDDHRVLKAYVEDADGKWTQFMTSSYTRKA